MITQHTNGQLTLLVAGLAILDDRQAKAIEKQIDDGQKGRKREAPSVKRPRKSFKDMTSTEYEAYMSQHKGI